jgi:hypothetical protein
MPELDEDGFAQRGTSHRTAIIFSSDSEASDIDEADTMHEAKSEEVVEDSPVSENTSPRTTTEKPLPTDGTLPDDIFLNTQELEEIFADDDENLFKFTFAEVSSEVDDFHPPTSGSFAQYRAEYDAFHLKTLRKYDKDVCAYVHPVSRKRKRTSSSPASTHGAVVPSCPVPWAWIDSPVMHFCEELFATKNICYEPSEEYTDNVFAVLRGTYTRVKHRTQRGCFAHTLSLSIEKGTTIPYYLNTCSDLACDKCNGQCEGLVNPFQYLMPFCAPDDANCEVVSVIDTMIQSEVLLLRSIRPILIGEQLCISQENFVPFKLSERGHGKKLIWLRDLTHYLTGED